MVRYMYVLGKLGDSILTLLLWWKESKDVSELWKRTIEWMRNKSLQSTQYI